jgi:hypothetical protein
LESGEEIGKPVRSKKAGAQETRLAEKGKKMGEVGNGQLAKIIYKSQSITI